MTDSIRKQILDNIVTAYGAITAPPYDLAISNANLGPLGDQDNRKRFVVGIVPGKEKFNNKFSWYQVTMPVAVEFRVTNNRDDPPPGDLAETVLKIVQQVAMVDGTWGALAIDTTFVSDEVNIDTYADKTIEGVLFFDVLYRYNRRDPTSPNPAF